MGIEEELFVNPDDLPQRLICPICLDVASDAVCTNCEHIYCKECLMSLQESNNGDCACPICRESIHPVIEAQNARKLIANQLVYCSAHENLRCGWTGKYGMYHTHKARECILSSASDKEHAKATALVSGLSNVTRNELSQMGVSRLKKILVAEMKRQQVNLNFVNQNGTAYDYNKFVEKSEYVRAVYDILHPNDRKSDANKNNNNNNNSNNNNNPNGSNDFKFNDGYDGRWHDADVDVMNNSPNRNNNDSNNNNNNNNNSISSDTFYFNGANSGQDEEADEKKFELFVQTREELSAKSVRQLKSYLTEIYKVDLKNKDFNIVEKKDLIDLILKLQKENGNNYNPKFEKMDQNNHVLDDNIDTHMNDNNSNNARHSNNNNNNSNNNNNNNNQNNSNFNPYNGPNQYNAYNQFNAPNTQYSFTNNERTNIHDTGHNNNYGPHRGQPHHSHQGGGGFFNSFFNNFGQNFSNGFRGFEQTVQQATSEAARAAQQAGYHASMAGQHAANQAAQQAQEQARRAQEYAQCARDEAMRAQQEATRAQQYAQQQAQRAQQNAWRAQQRAQQQAQQAQAAARAQARQAREDARQAREQARQARQDARQERQQAQQAQQQARQQRQGQGPNGQNYNFSFANTLNNFNFGLH